jgi:hypothetical protein
MATTNDSGLESSGIDTEPTSDGEPRTRCACEGDMIVVPPRDASGWFEVYSANDGHNEIYTVDLRTETCECGDSEHRKPEDGCKHIGRVKFGLGLLSVPAGVELDGCLVHTREKYGVGIDEAEVVVGANTSDPAAHEPVATDGGQIVEERAAHTGDTDEENENNPVGHEYTDRQIRRHAHDTMFDAYDYLPLPGFEPFQATIDLSTETVERLITETRTENGTGGD